MPRSSESPFDELKRYVAFSDGDAAALASFHPVATPHLDRIARVFYDRTRDHEAAHAVFRDEAQVDRLHRSLVRWLGRLFRGPYDEDYYQETLTIGRVHVQVNLPQRYMLTAMSLVRHELTVIAEREMPGGSAEVRQALAKILDLELTIMLESYHEGSLARQQQVERDEKAQLSRALARTEHRYLHAVKRAQVLIVGFDRKGLIHLFNLEAEKTTGLGPEEASRHTFSELFVTEETRESYEGSLRDVLEGRVDASFPLETTLMTPANRVCELRWHISYAATESEDDDVVFFAIGRDVSEENTLSEQSRRHEKLAAVGTLAAGLAHEIRNPLNGAQLHVSFLRRAMQKGAVTAEMVEATEVVGDEIRRLATLVTEFLEFARPRPLQRKPVTVGELCERAVQLVTPSAQAAGVSLVADLPSRDVLFSADRGKLEQVLLNVLKNAIEALAGTPGGVVTMRGRKQPRHVLFEVQDNGPGLPGDAPIFDAFFTTKPQGSKHPTVGGESQKCRFVAGFCLRFSSLTSPRWSLVLEDFSPLTRRNVLRRPG